MKILKLTFLIFCSLSFILIANDNIAVSHVSNLKESDDFIYRFYLNEDFLILKIYNTSEDGVLISDKIENFVYAFAPNKNGFISKGALGIEFSDFKKNAYIELSPTELDYFTKKKISPEEDFLRSAEYKIKINVLNTDIDKISFSANVKILLVEDGKLVQDVLNLRWGQMRR